MTAQDLATLSSLSQDFGECEAICLSQDPRRKQIGYVTVYPWKEGLRYIFQVPV